MRRNTTLLRAEQLLDLFHDGFHKLFGSPERRFKKGFKKAGELARLNKKDIAIKKELVALANEQEARLEFERGLQERKQIGERKVKERIDGLEQNRSAMTQDNDIEI